MSNHEPDPVLPSLPHRDLLFAPGASRALFEDEILPASIPGCRWFSGKARDPQRYTVRDVLPISAAPDAARLMLVEVEYADRGTDTWLLPLQLFRGQLAHDLVAQHPQSIVARFADGVLADATHDEAFRDALYTLLASQGTLPGEHGSLSAQSGPALQGIHHPPPSRAHVVEQSNSSVIYGEHVFLKLYRRLEPGLNPDAEILRFLSARGFTHTPPFAGSIEYRGADGQVCVLALGTGLVANNGDAWSFTLRELSRWFAALSEGEAVAAARIHSETLSRAAQLGTRTGELHLALAAAGTDDSDFSAEPLTEDDGRKLAEGILTSARQVTALIAKKLETLPDPARNLGQRFLQAEVALPSRVASFASAGSVAKIRTHGDYHLGQVLETGGDFVIIDFEGEPLRSLATRREKRSPWRDVAGMLRSFDYAAHAALDARPERQNALAAHASQWSADAQRAFLEAWLETTEGAVFRARTRKDENQLLEAFLLEKALYEVLYEINNRPTWLPIPLRGVLQLLEGSPT